ncbi:MAG: BMP family ABC transporter substrate-binding protein [Clostridia bacterium]|nr:BMP family ABC transporter substrate-binding protein [Clostridia bacterium]
MFKKVISSIVVLTMIAALLLTGCGSNSGSSNDSKVKVGFIYVGPAGDGGWTEAHNNGRLYLEKQLNIKTLYRESVPEGPECEKAIRDMIAQGCNVIFTTSFGFMDYTEKVAKEFPNIKFFHCSGYKKGENFANYFGRMYEPRYLSGIVAGMKTKANKIGYVAAFEIPEVINGINAFTLGVQSVNPNAIVKVKWTHTWIDSAKEKDAAVALLDEGCDVITQHNDSTAPQIAAEQRGVWAIGYDLDTPKAAPKAYMTAPIWNWGPYYVDQVKAIIDGTWKTSEYHGGLKEGIIDLAPLTDVAPAGAKEKVAEMRKKIEDGTFHVFAGPIKDQAGNIKVEAGKVLEYNEIMGTGMNWFVQGVEGKIEQSK